MDSVITVVGNIGSGKSTAVRELGSRLGAEVFIEDYRSNPYLARFYEEPRRWAFRSQLHFLSESAASDLAARIAEKSALVELGYNFVHSVMTTEMHAEGLIGQHEFALLRSLAAALDGQLRVPDLVVLLTAPVEELLRRIEARGRAFEFAIDSGYLERISSRYEEVLGGWTRSPTLRIDTTEIDVRDPGGAGWACKQIQTALAAA